MRWVRRRRQAIEDAGRRLAEAEQRVNTIVDRAARLERMKADVEIYTRKRQQKGSL